MNTNKTKTRVLLIRVYSRSFAAKGFFAYRAGCRNCDCDQARLFLAN